MSSGERRQFLRELLNRAAADKPANLGAWLDAQGVDDWQIREELLSLIQHQRSLAATGSSEGIAPSALSVERTIEPGQILGAYRIVRELGRGGMGRVYLAEDSRLGRMVALKALSPEFTTERSHRERLRREARAAAALSHPGICTVYAIEEVEGDLFIAAEFVDGFTLRQEISSGRRPESADVMRTAKDLASALACAHDHGIVHRDLKPENVMRMRDGRLKVLDFGLARMDPGATDSGRLASGVTQPGVIVGTPAYMAPEQLNGQAADMRSDVFAFGVLLYEYASGMHPFHAPQPLALIGRILESTAEPLDSRRGDLPPTLAMVIERCLRKPPGERFPSAAEVVRELDRTAVARPAGRMAPWWRAHQFVVVGLYLLACGMAWQVKEWVPGLSSTIFLTACVAATIAGVFRGHLVFVENVNPAQLSEERRRARPIALAMDLLIASLLVADGVLLSGARPVAAALTIGLGLGIALANVLIEPATASATFGS